MKTSESITKIAPALLKAQKKMDTVSKDASNPYYKSKYADINSFLQVAVHALNSEGIVVLQPTYSDGTSHYVETTLIHESGEYLSSKPLKLELNKIDMQQLGSAITYGRRYQLQALLGMMAADDDGEAAMNRPKKTELKLTPQAGTTMIATNPPQLADNQSIGSTGVVVTLPATPTPRTSFRRSTPAAATPTIKTDIF